MLEKAELEAHDTFAIAQESGAVRSQHRSIDFAGPLAASGKSMTLAPFYISLIIRYRWETLKELDSEGGTR
jgi:hypothetical protein